MSNVQQSPPTFDVDKRVAQFVQLRDKIKEVKERHEAELAPYNQLKEKIAGQLLAFLQSVNAENMRTDSGTAYLTTKVSATVADADAFWQFVLANQAFDLIDKRANAPAVTDYIEKNKAVPPGLNYNTRLDVGVRRS